MLNKLKTGEVKPAVAISVIIVLLLILGYLGWRIFGRSGPSAVHVTTQQPGQPFAGAKRVYGTP
ncbi:MAG TPA: hypothetical protein VKV29_13750 [Chthonomonas sp.]|jgi:hypothetical protein|uniref:hypothetical protein n=1 Tax=Chthonomonas sp. TaxID=2282153 RepID=UPI002B4B18FF|nr:hypothetical protein [Chthonomonas sp.]HLH81333.1 hypothetical protein [Chthonomonas sp.]